jgi:hypothetical protein
MSRGREFVEKAAREAHVEASRPDDYYCRFCERKAAGTCNGELLDLVYRKWLHGDEKYCKNEVLSPSYHRSFNPWWHGRIGYSGGAYSGKRGRRYR